MPQVSLGVLPVFGREAPGIESGTAGPSDSRPAGGATPGRRAGGREPARPAARVAGASRPRLQCEPVPAPASRSRWLPALLFAAGATALYAGALGTGFLNDDFLFLEDARRGFGSPLAGGLANYFRPLSRQLWFGSLAAIAGPNALAFHVANFALFLGAAALLRDLLRAFAPPRGAWLALAAFAVLPFQRVNLTWVSCCQDLLALLGTLGALALFRRGRDRLALLAWLGAVLSKESALPLPALLFVWSWRIDGAPARTALRRVAPFALPALVWLAGEVALRAAAPAPATLRFGPLEFVAAWAHLVQSVTGFDNPHGLAEAFWRVAPTAGLLGALAAFVALAWFVTGSAGNPGPAPPAAPRATEFGLAWLALFALPVGPVVHGWSAYFYTTAAVGAAVLLAPHAARLPRAAAAGTIAIALWWHAAASAVPAFAVVEAPWIATSHLTAHYFERGAALSARLRAALHRVAPAPAAGTRFFFATLPPYAGFQMGNGAAIRAAYRDPSLESHFYSAFSDSTAGDAPCVFLFWNGADFDRLYGDGRDPFFQVGTDLLLLGRPAGAAHAFARGLAANELREDHLYWSGWALLWSGRRAAAERAWAAFGAQDDTTMYRAWLRAAVTALADGDSTTARRHLFAALRAGIGRPEVHVALADLLRGRSAKFSLLETQVTAYLKPLDTTVRGELVAGLAAARLDDAARRELAALQRIDPSWPADTTLVRLDRLLGGRAPGAGGVAVLPWRNR